MAINGLISASPCWCINIIHHFDISNWHHNSKLHTNSKIHYNFWLHLTNLYCLFRKFFVISRGLSSSGSKRTLSPLSCSNSISMNFLWSITSSYLTTYSYILIFSVAIVFSNSVLVFTLMDSWNSKSLASTMTMNSDIKSAMTELRQN